MTLLCKRANDDDDDDGDHDDNDDDDDDDNDDDDNNDNNNKNCNGQKCRRRDFKNFIFRYKTIFLNGSKMRRAAHQNFIEVFEKFCLVAIRQTSKMTFRSLKLSSEGIGKLFARNFKKVFPAAVLFKEEDEILVSIYFLISISVLWLVTNTRWPLVVSSFFFKYSCQPKGYISEVKLHDTIIASCHITNHKFLTKNRIGA